MSTSAIALVFPGQGSQAPGMGRALVESGHQTVLLRLAEKAGIPLERLLVTGTAEELRPTDVAQPALFYTGVALAGILTEGGLRPAAAAGHSLGEYCAVVAAGSLTPEEGMLLVIERGRLMAEAPDGTMAAVLGLDLETVETLCHQAEAGGECCVVANDNAPGQVVVSGSRSGLDRLADLAKEAGARRVVLLNVGGAFHSPLMASAAEAFSRQLDQVSFRDPSFPVAAGVRGAVSSTGAEVRAALRDQLAGPVRWVSAIKALAASGAETFVECGPGSVLAGLNRRILPSAATISIDSPEGCTELLAVSSAPGAEGAAQEAG